MTLLIRYLVIFFAVPWNSFLWSQSPCENPIYVTTVIKIAKRHRAYFGYGEMKPIVSFDKDKCTWTVSSVTHRNHRRSKRRPYSRATVITVELTIDALTGKVISRQRKRSVWEYLGGRGGAC